MKPFRFVILGAAKIGAKFCDAVTQIEDCEVIGVASKSFSRAETFARQNNVTHFYDSYEEMLQKEQPDAAYIAVTPNDHARLSELCIKYKVPVLCEKAMFQDSDEARYIFALAKQSNTFVMEALWSRFLPAVRQAKKWIEEGKIGTPETLECSIGFCAPEGMENRYWNPELGGGAAKDITVYAYEIAAYILNQSVKRITAFARRGETGVDVTDHVFIEFTDTMAELTTTFAARMEEKMTISGPKGRIVIPAPHKATGCFLCHEDGETEEFTDEKTRNGFVYEIEEVIKCVKKGCIESKVNPWADTIACAELFDLINAEITKNE